MEYCPCFPLFGRKPPAASVTFVSAGSPSPSPGCPVLQEVNMEHPLHANQPSPCTFGQRVERRDSALSSFWGNGQSFVCSAQLWLLRSWQPRAVCKIYISTLLYLSYPQREYISVESLTEIIICSQVELIRGSLGIPIFDLYSYRKRVAEGETPYVLIYREMRQKCEGEVGVC